MPTMPNFAIAYGLVLILLGAGSFVATGSKAPTALIPAAIGLLVLICGVLAQKERLRKHAMHAAAVLGLVGIIGGLRALPGLLKVMTTGGMFERPAATGEQLALLVLSLVFVGFCVYSFISARRGRTA
ncbi:MAG TPA: hypothetical protein VGE98_07170 [Thermoanaerobaculia bacterium]